VQPPAAAAFFSLALADNFFKENKDDDSLLQVKKMWQRTTQFQNLSFVKGETLEGKTGQLYRLDGLPSPEGKI